jgi:hypothetical protein
MKSKLNLEVLLYAAVIVLSVIALVLSLMSYQFTDTKLIYEGF